MRRLTLFVWISLLLFYSCSNDIENKIEGQWLLKTIEQDGIVSKVDTVFYSFQKGYVFAFTTMSYSNIEESSISYGYLNIPSEKQIVVAMDTSRNENGYFKNINNNFLELSGWEHYQRTFIVEKINGKNLVLSSDQKVYSFKKY